MIKTALSFASLALVFSAYAAFASLQRSSQEPGDLAGQTAASPDTLGGFATAVEELRAEVDALSRRIGSLELNSVGSVRRPLAGEQSVTRAELDALEEELAALVGEGGLAVGSEALTRGETDLKQKVQDSLREIEIEQAQEKAQEWANYRIEHLTERLPVAAEKLGLASNQTNQLEGSLSRLYDAQATYGSLKASGEVQTSEQWNELIEGDMGRFMGELEGFLSTDQMELYLSLGDGWAFPGSDAGGGSGQGFAGK